MTTDPQNCPQCGAPLPANAPAGLCPRCVMAMNMATETEFSDEVGPHGTRVLKQPPTPAELADKFPQLEILELLGRGGMGVVYKARQKELDRIVALKILPPGIGESPAFAERFSREAKALAKLNHPNIVTLYEFGRADGLFFFLMEFVDGVNLRQLLDTGRVASREALAIVPQICDALQYAHDHGIVHRDIKPENILMDRRGRVKVADFGLAKLVGVANESFSESGDTTQSPSLTEAGKIMGTPQYMAPEQRDKPLEVDHRADIYALGVVFYQMLTGELPGKRMEAPSRKVQIDVRLDEIVLRALEKRPELRFQSAEELKTRVETMGARSESPDRENPLSESHQHGNMPVFANFKSLQVVLVTSVVVAAVWSFFSVGGAMGRMIFVPVFVLGVFWLIQRVRRTSNESSERSNFNRRAAPPAADVSGRNRGMPKVLWIAFISLAVSAVFNTILKDGFTQRGLMDAVLEIGIPSILAVGLYFRIRIAYLLTIVATFDATALAFKLPTAFGFLLIAICLGIVFPIVASTQWFFPLEASRSRRRIWLGATTVLALVNFAVMLAMPLPTYLHRLSKAGHANRGIDIYPSEQEQLDAAEVFPSEQEQLDAAEVFPSEQDQLDAAETFLNPDLTSGEKAQPGVKPKTKFATKLPDVAFVEKEGVLNDPDNGDGKTNRETIVLRTGKMLNALGAAPKLEGGRMRALVASEGDLFAEYDDFVSKQWALVAAGMKFSDFLTARWDKATFKDVDEALKDSSTLQQVERYGATLYLLPDGLVPITLAFETRDGDRGLLQVTRFNSNPRSLNIRYKLVHGTNSGTSANGEAPIPPEASKLLEKIKLVYQTHSRTNSASQPNADAALVENVAAITKELTLLLKGTVAEPLLEEQQAETLKYQEALKAKDLVKAKEAQARVQSLGREIVGLINPNAVKATGSSKVETGTTGAQGRPLSPAPGEYKVKLTNGIEVEVIAVTRDPLKNERWWKPDGTLLAKPPGEHIEYYKTAMFDKKDIGGQDHAILVQYSMTRGGTGFSAHQDHFLPNAELRGSLQLRTGDSIDIAVEDVKRWGRMLAGGAGGPKPGYKDIGTAHVIRFPSGTEEASVQFAIAANPWEEVALFDGNKTKLSVSGIQVLCTPVPADPRSGGKVLHVTHDIDLDRYALRMFAVLKNGKREETRFYTDHPKAREKQSAVFLGGFEQNAANVKEYILERTPWVRGEIGGIALTPGIKSDSAEARPTRQRSPEPNVTEAKNSITEESSYLLKHRPQLGQKVLDASRDFAVEHQWKVEGERGRTENGVETVTIEATDLSGKKVLFTELAQPGQLSQLTVTAEPGSEFSAHRIGTAIARRLGLSAGFTPQPASQTENEILQLSPVERFAGGDTNKLYYLIGETNVTGASKDGFRLLLVLPGGDGGRDFQPFLKRTYTNALPAGYLLVQLVAPKWDNQQFEKVVWPTEKNRYPGMGFSTEQFVSAVVSEIEKQHRVDARHIYSLSWSSGGPAGYAISLQPESKVTGSFIAMSVFKPDQLPGLNTAKGHAYYILHSPEDFIPLRMAEQARDLLQKNGAITHLQTYAGGHGWKGDVFGNIRKGVEWLEENAADTNEK